MSDGSVTIEVTLTKEQLEKSLKSLKSTIDKSLPNASKTLSTFANGFEKIGSICTQVGKKLSIITTGFTGLTTYVINVGKSFESQMSKVSAISGAVGSELEQLKAKAVEMGSKTKFSATEAGQAFEYMAMAGWKTEDMLDGISGIMNLAAGSGEELATVSDIVTDALTAFGLQAKDSSHFADVLAKASSNSNTNVRLMGETFKYVAPLAGAMKYSIEDTAVAIGLMANAGIKGSQAGTALRSMLTRLVKPPKEAAEALEELKISVKNSDGTIKPFSQTLNELRTKFANLSESQKASFASSIAGQEAMSGLLAIVNASESDYNKLVQSINNANGAAQEMADTMNDNLEGAITLFKSNLEGIGVSLYENFQNPIKELVQNCSSLLTSLKPVFSGMFSVINPLIQNFSNVINNLTTTLNNMSVKELENLGKNIFKIISAGPTLLIVGKGFSEISTAFKGLGKGFTVIDNLTNKISGLGKSVIEIPSFFSGIGTKATTAMAGIKTAFDSTILKTSLFSQLVKFDLVEGFNQAFPKISGVLGNIGNLVTNCSTKITGGFSVLTSKIEPIFSNLGR